MSDRLDLHTRDELRAKIEATVGAIQSRATDLTAEAIAAEVQADAEEFGLRCFQLAMLAAHGPNLGAAIFADLTGHLEQSDAELARRYGLTRQAVSKTLRRVRRNLGLPVRMPSKSRAGWRAKKGPRAAL